jgi:hypothetical protein
MDDHLKRRISRRGALRAIGGVGALFLFDCQRASSISDGGVDSGSNLCVLDPNLTKGPYWIDERLQRADITSDSYGKASPNPRPGLPLSLRFQVLAWTDSGCSALGGAQVDLWHCDGSGLYSDVTAGLGNPDTTGAYNTRGARDTRNSADSIYNGRTPLLVSLAGDALSGYAGSITLGVKLGTVSAG